MNKSLLSFLLLVFAFPAFGQKTPANPFGASLNVQDAGTCSTSGSFIWQTSLSPNASTTTVTVSGTFSATLTVRESNNGGAAWSTAGTVASAGTTTYSTNGFTDFCVDVTSYTSGTAYVSIFTGATGSGPGGGGGAPSGPAGGELAGTFPNPTILRSLSLAGNPFAITDTFSTASAYYSSFDVAVGGCSASNANLVGANLEDVVSGCITTPSSGINTQVQAGVGGYAIINQASKFGVGVFGKAYCAVASTECEGLVGGAKAANSGDVGIGVESNPLIGSTSVGTSYAYYAAPGGTAQPTADNLIAYFAQKGGTLDAGTTTFTSGFQCGQSAIVVVSSFYAPCFRLQPISTSASALSQTIEFNSLTSASAKVASVLLQSVDTANHQSLRWGDPAASASGGNVAVLPDHTATNFMSTNNAISAGTISVSASTSGSTTFTRAYLAAPLCTIVPISDPTSVGVYWVTSSTTAVTANVKTSGTITFNYRCTVAAN